VNLVGEEEKIGSSTCENNHSKKLEREREKWSREAVFPGKGIMMARELDKRNSTAIFEKGMAQKKKIRGKNQVKYNRYGFLRGR